MRLFMLCFSLLVLLLAPDAQAGVVVSVWSPGVLIFDPYDPGYRPDPRPDYIWVPGGYDEFGYFVPGYWQPVALNPGYSWSSGYWTGRSYHEGYWRPDAQPGHAWVDGYYVRGNYVHPRWVRADHADRARAAGHKRVERHEYVNSKGHHHPHK